MRGSQVPATMITATTDPAVELPAAELGIKQVLQKPLSSLIKCYCGPFAKNWSSKSA